MSNLFNLGASAMMAQSLQLETIGNNIANSGTAGYKRGTMAFAEAFYEAGAAQPGGMRPQVGQGVQALGLESDWKSGAQEETGVPTHLSINGNGFFPVDYQGMTGYSRAGDFSWLDYGVQSGGAGTGYVLGRPNGALLLDSSLELLRFDAVPTSFEVAEDGAVRFSGANLLGGSAALGVQRFGTPDALERLEGGVYRSSDRAAPLSSLPETPASDGVGSVLQGRLERSNVDMVEEFTDLISAQRTFQANSRTISTADELMQEVLRLKR